MAKEQFKTTDALFGKITEDFASFNQAQIIDEGRFYKDVVYILNLLGIAWYREAEEVVDIKNYVGKLPCDFDLLDSAYKCDGKSYDNADANMWNGLVMQQLSFSHYPSTQPDYHGSPCGCNGSTGTSTCCPTGYTYNVQTEMCVCVGANCLSAQPIPPIPCSECANSSSDAIFNTHVLTLVKRDSGYIQYSNPTLLRIGNVQTKRKCTGNCANTKSTSSDTITIEGERIYTNFRDGHVILKYHALPMDEETGLPLIPNDEIIEKCIEYYIKKNIIENIWVNGDADVDRKVSYFKNEYKEALGQAMYQTKLPTFRNMVDQIRLKRKMLDVYQINTQPH